MKYRKATLLNAESINTAGTKTLDLDFKSVMSRLQIKVNATNSSADPTAVHAKQVSKVQIVDGSKVLLELSGQQIEAKGFYDKAALPSYEREFRNGVENYLTLSILFGRRLWDSDLGFDPKQFSNPQLKITHNKALGGSLPTSGSLSVFADLFDEKVVTPRGFIRSTQHHSFTSASSSAYDYINLPKDMIIKRIMLQTYKADSWWENLVANIKIDEDSGGKVPIDLTGQQLVSLVHGNYGPFEELLVGQCSGIPAVTFYVTPTDSCYMMFSPILANASSYVGTDLERTGGYQTIINDDSRAWRAIVKGFLPHGCLPIDLGDPDDMDDWYDVTQKGKVQLIPYASGEVAFNTILEQLQKY